MDTQQAELIYEAGKEAVIKALLEMGTKVKTLEEQLLALQKQIASARAAGVGPRQHAGI